MKRFIECTCGYVNLAFVERMEAAKRKSYGEGERWGHDLIGRNGNTLGFTTESVPPEVEYFPNANPAIYGIMFFSQCNGVGAQTTVGHEKIPIVGWTHDGDDPWRAKPVFPHTTDEAIGIAVCWPSDPSKPDGKYTYNYNCDGVYDDLDRLIAEVREGFIASENRKRDTAERLAKAEAAQPKPEQGAGECQNQ